MAEIQDKVIEEMKSLPEDILESVFDFVEYLKAQRRKIEKFESRYGSLSEMESKITTEEHTWEEEKDLFEWEATITEMGKMKKILKAEGED